MQTHVSELNFRRPQPVYPPFRNWAILPSAALKSVAQ
jgi:hypothetical protein